MRKIVLLTCAALMMATPAAAPAKGGGWEKCGRAKSSFMIFLPCWLTGDADR